MRHLRCPPPRPRPGPGARLPPRCARARRPRPRRGRGRSGGWHARGCCHRLRRGRRTTASRRWAPRCARSRARPFAPRAPDGSAPAPRCRATGSRRRIPRCRPRLRRRWPARPSAFGQPASRDRRRSRVRALRRQGRHGTREGSPPIPRPAPLVRAAPPNAHTHACRLERRSPPARGRRRIRRRCVGRASPGAAGARRRSSPSPRRRRAAQAARARGYSTASTRSGTLACA